jgi:hypothetical protein
MQKKIITTRSSKFIKFATLTKIWHPVERNGWWIKFSTYFDTKTINTYVLLMFTSASTGQTIIRYFPNEVLAVEFINYIINTDPTADFFQEELPE